MLWLKAFHVIFVITWFAGLFYLPRLFIYHVEASEPATRARLEVMARRLLGITRIGGALAVVFGLALMGWWIGHDPAVLFAPQWFKVKLALVAVLIAYHLMLGHMTRQLTCGGLRWSSRALRLFNEIPSLLVVAIVIMVVVKPF